MIGTHAPKMLNGRLKQAAICANIIADIPKTYICSSTVNLSRKYWSLPINAPDIGKFKETAAAAQTADRSIPALTAGNMRQIIIPWKDTHISISPVPSCGLINEIWKRPLGTRHHWVIQPTPTARGNHGEPMTVQYGKVKLMMRGVRRTPPAKDQEKTQYIEIAANAQGMSIASGFVSMGWPAITAIGGLVHAIELATGIDNIPFAFGMRDVSFSFGAKKFARFKNKKPTTGLVTDEVTGSGNVVILLKTDQFERISEAFKSITRIAGGSIFDLKINARETAEFPHAAYLFDASEDVQLNEKTDALGAAIELYSQERSKYALSQAGYALLDNPVSSELSRKPLHAWAEPVFCVVKQGAFNKNAWWQRHDLENFVVWKSGISV